MSPRPIFALASLVLIAGACVLTFFVLLAGAVNGNPVNQFYFIQADTSAISGAPPVSRWTLWNVCSVDGNGRNACPGANPAYPFDPQSNFGTTNNLPADFNGTNKYYYLTRFMFAFFLIALFFMVVSLFLGAFALCSRIGSYLSSVTCLVALFFQTLVAALMTATYVLARNAFQSNGDAVSLGQYNFGFVWAAMACLVIATVLFCLGGSMSNKNNSYKAERRSEKRGLFGKKKNTRSRGSFIDTESQRHVVESS